MSMSPVYNLNPKSKGWRNFSPREMLQEQLSVIEGVFDSIDFMRANLKSETARSFIEKVQEVQDAFNCALEDACVSLLALQGQADLIAEIEIETAEIEAQ